MQSIPNVPPAVRQVVEGLVEAAQRAFGDDLKSAILYGSGAEGRLRATSDVNLLFCSQIERETPMRSASRSDSRRPRLT